MIVAVLAVAAAGAHLGSAAIARHRAQAAADLAAFSAAVRLTAGPDAACATAQTVTEAVGADLSVCRIEGLDVTVQVSVPVHLPWSVGPARAVARAGPL
ncbi:Rv3654c family TadE-like protein [Mycobacterium sp. SMC-4]|uniref:Rv3654c family TadE-like protein n=1 Tax=Mycobacterium sp. SMC-4 TaxID=2857059 RepID=UPI0021B38E71|nr:Rv3654c family TadE-like protein [Mycobacterium sp. SMC-4]